jgi:hypothetical protein
MALLSILYLEVFVLITSLGLWHRNLSGTAVDHMTAHTPIYQAVLLATLIVSPCVLFLIVDHSTILSLKASFTMDRYGTVFYFPPSLTTACLLSCLQGLVCHTT